MFDILRTLLFYAFLHLGGNVVYVKRYCVLYCCVYRNIDIVSYQYDFLHIGAHQYGWLNSNIQILPVGGGGMKM